MSNHSQARRAAAQRYRKWPNFYYYAQGKIALDPAYPAVADALAGSARPLLDIGCGMGLLTAYLRGRGHRAAVAGLDVDGEKIALAAQVLSGEGASFRTGDARELPPHEGDVVMLDVLHYFDDAEQKRLLENVAHRVAPGGAALIRIALEENNWRCTLTRWEEELIKWAKWIPVQGRNFPTRDEVMAPFLEQGFTADCRPMWGLTPFNSYFFAFRRPAISPTIPVL